MDVDPACYRAGKAGVGRGSRGGRGRPGPVETAPRQSLGTEATASSRVGRVWARRTRRCGQAPRGEHCGGGGPARSGHPISDGRSLGTPGRERSLAEGLGCSQEGAGKAGQLHPLPTQSWGAGPGCSPGHPRFHGFKGTEIPHRKGKGKRKGLVQTQVPWCLSVC